MKYRAKVELTHTVEVEFETEAERYSTAFENTAVDAAHNRFHDNFIGSGIELKATLKANYRIDGPWVQFVGTCSSDIHDDDEPIREIVFLRRRDIDWTPEEIKTIRQRLLLLGFNLVKDRDFVNLREDGNALELWIYWPWVKDPMFSPEQIADLTAPMEGS